MSGDASYEVWHVDAINGEIDALSTEVVQELILIPTKLVAISLKLILRNCATCTFGLGLIDCGGVLFELYDHRRGLQVGAGGGRYSIVDKLSLIHISEPTRLLSISYA